MHSDLLEPQISLQSNSNQPFHTSAMAGNKAQRGKGKKTGYTRNPAPRPDDPESIDHLQDRAEIEALKVQVDQLKKEKKGLKGYFKAIVAQRVKLEERDTENKVFNEGALKMLKDTEMLEAEEEFSGLTIRENEH